MAGKTLHPNERKLRELLLYVSQKCAFDPAFGAAKLSKILFCSDFFAFARTGAAITGVEYVRTRNGPAPRALESVRDRMIQERILGLQEVVLKSGKVQTRTVSLRQPGLGIFTGGEIAMVDYVIDALSDNGSQTESGLSRWMVGWQAAREGETIPYTTVFLSNEPLSEAEIFRGLEIAAQIKRTAA